MSSESKNKELFDWGKKEEKLRYKVVKAFEKEVKT
jgi:hypothetical protein